MGLTTALAVLPGGWVIVGSTPSANGQAATASAGCLIVVGAQGHVRETIAGHGINGPWDATALSSGPVSDLFVTNVLNGTVAAGGAVVHRGTVLRLRLTTIGSTPPQLVDVATIASGLAEETSAAAFVLGRPAWGWPAAARCMSPTPPPARSPPSRTRCSGTGARDRACW